MTIMVSRFYHGGSELWKKELKRKAFHQLILLYLAAYFLLGHPAAAYAMAAFTVLVAAVELLRLKAAWARPFFNEWFGGIIRVKEAERFSGSFYVCLGVLAVFVFFGSDSAIVTAALLALSLGDAVSPLVGMRFGWRPFTVMGIQRSLDGSLAAFLTVLAIGLLTGFPPLVALGAAAAFSVVDTLPLKPDDNFWIPVVYACALYMLGRLFV